MEYEGCCPASKALSSLEKCSDSECSLLSGLQLGQSTPIYSYIVLKYSEGVLGTNCQLKTEQREKCVGVFHQRRMEGNGVCPFEPVTFNL